jgi:UDP-N-acetylglucosamine:LPS N-acetylglucosamine transferase
MKTIDLIYFNAGGGHRAAATALESVVREQGRPWRTRLLNLVDVLDPMGRFRKVTGMAPEDLYNKRLAKGWTLGLGQELKLLQGMIRLGHAPMVQRLQRHWAHTAPDMVVSLVPNFNRALHDSVAGALPGVPFVTVMTDLADHPPHFWIEPNLRQWLVCGSDRAAAQARAMGYDSRQIFQTSGMILRPDFYRPAAPGTAADRAAQRRELGLDPDRPTGIVMFGGQGSAAMRTIAKELSDVQLIFLCGHNHAIADRLRAMEGSAPRFVLGFSAEVPRYMRLADFFIGKPGPGALSEALQLGLPVVTTLNAWTMPQERYNAQWVRERQVGVVCASLRTMRSAVNDVIRHLPELRARVAQLDNRAVFELPDIFESIFGMSLEAAPELAQARPVELAATRRIVATTGVEA